MARVPLRETGTIRLGVGGIGTVRIGPRSAREVWHPDNVHVSCSTNVLESSCTIYAGADISSATFRDESQAASTGEASGAVSADTLEIGKFVFAVWVGGDVGALATLTVTGTRDV